jgi:uncharacterized protein (DUF433 family)
MTGRTSHERRAIQLAKGVTSNPEVCGGKPVLKGTRMAVAIVVGSLAGGMTEAEVCEEYDLTPVQIRAALAYAAKVIEEGRFVPLPPR